MGLIMSAETDEEEETEAAGLKDWSSLRIGVRGFGTVVASLPAFGLAACVLYSMINDFEGATATDCGAQNYLPSASAATGLYTPQRYIWRICIGLHCTPRLFFTAIYYDFFMSFWVGKRQDLYELLVKTAAALNVCEIFCLILLTFISSTENYDVHERCFVGFLIFSEFYMVFSCILWSWSSMFQPSALKTHDTLQLKILLFVANLLSIGGSAYFFIRHNSYCEPGIYSGFALCEYITILTNIAFHGLITVDFATNI